MAREFSIPLDAKRGLTLEKDPFSNVGYLRPTSVGGPWAGAEYVLTQGPGSVLTQGGWLRYGFYQYFSFLDVEGTEVTVQVMAPSFDFPAGWMDLDDDSPSILDGDAEPLELVDHEVVQSRFACGRELANRLAPITASLDTA